ncbi:unnamed protein product [Paramecium pentaurelia]|uniref:Uncharacterized protein n=1 Tax=Paramecium pentaurelia TaxID=43138 RepID=A0A8S1SVL3_9CILI|nr:unnamed protein product [Paramecium pentaurelia]
MQHLGFNSQNPKDINIQKLQSWILKKISKVQYTQEQFKQTSNFWKVNFQDEFPIILTSSNYDFNVEQQQQYFTSFNISTSYLLKSQQLSNHKIEAIISNTTTLIKRYINYNQTKTTQQSCC